MNIFFKLVIPFRYKFHFPFLQTNGNVTVDDNRVGPLYKHVFPPLWAPCLSFIGLPWKVRNATLLSATLPLKYFCSQ